MSWSDNPLAEFGFPDAYRIEVADDPEDQPDASVAPRIHDGFDALGLWLGRGWFAKHSSYRLADGSPRGRATLTLEFEDISEREVPDREDISEREDGPIVDFGQNLTGWVEIEIDGADAGDEIRLHHAEALTANGELFTTDLRSADATDTYIARGNGTETYEPGSRITASDTPRYRATQASSTLTQ